MPVRLLQITALAAFFCASANAQQKQIPTSVPVVEVRQSGNAFTWTPATPNNSTINRAVPLGQALVTGQSVSDAEPKVNSRLKLPVGKGAEVSSSIKIPKANFAKALVAAAKGAGKIALPGVAAVALDALLDHGLKNVKVGDDGNLTASGVDPAAEYWISDGRVWTYGDKPFNSVEQACAYGLSTQSTGWIVVSLKTTHIYSDLVSCQYTLKIGEGYEPFNRVYNIASPSYSNCLPGYYVTSNSCTKEPPTKAMSENEIADKIASESGWPSSSAIALQKMIQDPAIHPYLITPGMTDGITLTGPASAPGATTTGTEPVSLIPGTNTPAPPGATNTDAGTKTTTKTTSHPLQYSGNTVTTSTVNNTTTNITNNVTNVTTTEKKTEQTEDDKEPTECEKYPNRVGCKDIDFDTPEGEIPKKQIDVSWSPVDLGLGGGSCPAPVPIYENKQFSYQLACDNLYIIKPMVIGIALFVGGMILFGGRADQ